MDFNGSVTKWANGQFTGDVTIGGTLTVEGKITGGSIDSKGDLSVDGKLTATGDITSATIRASTQPYYHNQNTSAQTIPSTTPTTMLTPTEIDKVGTAVSYSSGVWTVAEAGVYAISYSAHFAGGINGYRQSYILLSNNANRVGYSWVWQSTANQIALNGTTSARMQVGDTFRVIVNQSGNTTLDVSDSDITINKVS